MKNTPLLEDLRLFCQVAHKTSFAATALELGISKAVVSKRIGMLEAAPQVRLLHRTTRRVSVTDHGEIVRQWAQRILEDIEQMGEAVTQSKLQPQGVLRICSSSGFGRNRLGPALSQLARQYPDLKIQLELLDRPVDLLGEGFDLDIRIGVVHEPDLIAHRIASNQRVLCAAPAYLEQRGAPAPLAQLRERDQDGRRWKLQGPHGPETVKVDGPLSANNGEIVHQWALDGHGIILRSAWDVESSLTQGKLVRILPAYQQAADVWAVTTSRLSNSAKVRACVQFLQQWLQARA
ncbi:LysR family transcriptional regulator [Janthinobacterium sp. P210006]|uniref:LysR family transcriptional regulator n=1 Tax=Janthinobacterium sp. P210006 TaxID=3112939 RepID=UPI002E2543AF|nr:LysR family transcriptional regulator [Janthinobacterium sp. P210006]